MKKKYIVKCDIVDEEIIALLLQLKLININVGYVYTIFIKSKDIETIWYSLHRWSWKPAR